jgi:hypothetical protein
MERWYQTLKVECIRVKTPLSLGEARRIVAPLGIGTKATNRRHVIASSEVLISRTQFLHFTLNHYNGQKLQVPPQIG